MKHTGGKGIDREELQGNPKDPTGLARRTTDSANANDQQMPNGAEGREGGAAGKFTRGFLEGGEAARPGGKQDPQEVRDRRNGKS